MMESQKDQSGASSDDYKDNHQHATTKSMSHHTKAPFKASKAVGLLFFAKELGLIPAYKENPKDMAGAIISDLFHLMHNGSDWKKNAKSEKVKPVSGRLSLHVFLDMLAGSQVAGALLYEIQFRLKRFGYPRYDKQGELRRWVKFTREQWMKLSLLTKSQYDESLKRLKQKGLIVVEHVPLKNLSHGRITLIRLSELTEGSLLAHAAGKNVDVKHSENGIEIFLDWDGQKKNLSELLDVLIHIADKESTEQQSFQAKASGTD